jgi:hypothetical protein
VNKNDYSKFKYENNYQLKYSVNPYTQSPSILNTELKTIKPNLGLNIFGSAPHSNIEQTIVIDNIYSCQQVDYVDRPIVPIGSSSIIKRIFFKLSNF